MANALLETKGLHRFFGGLHAVNDVSIDVQKGMIKGVIGPKLQFRRFAEGSKVQAVARIGRSPLAVFRPTDGGKHQHGNFGVGELP